MTALKMISCLFLDTDGVRYCLNTAHHQCLIQYKPTVNSFYRKGKFSFFYVVYLRQGETRTFQLQLWTYCLLIHKLPVYVCCGSGFQSDWLMPLLPSQKGFQQRTPWPTRTWMRAACATTPACANAATPRPLAVFTPATSSPSPTPSSTTALRRTWPLLDRSKVKLAAPPSCPRCDLCMRRSVWSCWWSSALHHSKALQCLQLLSPSQFKDALRDMTCASRALKINCHDSLNQGSVTSGDTGGSFIPLLWLFVSKGKCKPFEKITA